MKLRFSSSNLILLVWIALLGAGFGALWTYSTRPGRAATPPERWPSDSALKQDESCTVLVFLHPHCPCSRATLQQLARVQARTEAQPVRVVFYQADRFSEEWTRTDLWNLAVTIPGVVPVADSDGREAARFGVYTSGQVLVYQRERLRMSAGLTSSRGHEGDSAGSLSLTKLLQNLDPPVRNAEVYGCSVRDGAE